jgi:hypothetical protein
MKLYGVCVLAAALCVGCGGDDDDPAADAAAGSFDAAAGSFDGGEGTDAAGATDARGADAGAFSITSTAYAEGGVIPTAHSCQGADISPALMWSNPPAGTMAFAIVFTDATTDFLHSAIWDIPANRFELPEDVDKDYEPADVPGAKQPNNFWGDRGYAGPCPQQEHEYEHRLHAINVATLGGVGQQSTRAQVVAAVEAASLADVALTASFDPN